MCPVYIFHDHLDPVKYHLFQNSAHRLFSYRVPTFALCLEHLSQVLNCLAQVLGTHWNLFINIFQSVLVPIAHLRDRIEHFVIWIYSWYVVLHVGDVRHISPSVMHVGWTLFQLSQPSTTQLQAVNYMCFSAFSQSVSDINFITQSDHSWGSQTSWFHCMLN